MSRMAWWVVEGFPRLIVGASPCFELPLLAHRHVSVLSI
jgi:hypothetical protein